MYSFVRRRIDHLRAIYDEYPRQFWIVLGASFIDSLGGAMVFPFFTLYMTDRYTVGMTEVGLLFSIFSISGVIGSTIGGALADRFGRKGMVLFGLVMSALISILMGVANSLTFFVIVILPVGFLADAGGPARQAMLADILPEEKRADGFGLVRVMHNLTVVIGPVIGGILASHSYILIFVADAVVSVITALIVFFAIPETMPEHAEDAPKPSILETFRGYKSVMRDKSFLLLMLAQFFIALVYMNINTTLGVYMRDTHHMPKEWFGALLSLNATIVVLLQFWVTRRSSRFPPALVMAAGTMIYVVGFISFGLIASYPLFIVTMAALTVGEMLNAPTSQALASQLSPEDMRGRYMAFFSYAWMGSSIFGPPLAGLILDNADQRLLWIVLGLLATIPVGLLLLLYRRMTGGAAVSVPSEMPAPVGKD